MINPRVFNEQLTLKKLIETEEDRFEYINGEIYMMVPGPSSNHGKITVDLVTIINNYLFQNDLNYQIFTAPQDVYLLNETNYVQPDVFVVCDENKIYDNGIHGAPDLIIEVASPSTRKRDNEEKFRLYQTAGVKEYWIVDYEQNQVKVFDFINNSSWDGRFAGVVKSNLFPGLTIDFDRIKKRKSLY